MSTAQAVESTDKHVLYDKQALSHIDRKNEPRIVMIDDWGFRRIFKEKNAACHLPLRKNTDQSESLTVLIDGVCVTCC